MKNRQERDSPVTGARRKVSILKKQKSLKEVGIRSAEARLLLEEVFFDLSGRHRVGSEGTSGDAEEGDDCNELHVGR